MKKQKQSADPVAEFNKIATGAAGAAPVLEIWLQSDRAPEILENHLDRIIAVSDTLIQAGEAACIATAMILQEIEKQDIAKPKKGEIYKGPFIEGYQENGRLVFRTRHPAFSLVSRIVTSLYLAEDALSTARDGGAALG